MEEHLWGEELLVAHIDRHHASVDTLVHELLELARLDPVSFVVLLFLVEFGELSEDVLADVAVLLLDFGGDLIMVLVRDLVGPVSGTDRVHNEASDIFASQRNVLHARRDHVRVTHWVHVGAAIASIDNEPRHILLGQRIQVRLILVV